jgi:hypothetical protein
MKLAGHPHPMWVWTGECTDEEKTTACGNSYIVPRVCDIPPPCQ